MWMWVVRVPNNENRIKLAAWNVQSAKRTGNSTKQASILLGVNAIDVVNVIECTHPNRYNMVIRKKHACWQSACTWKAAVLARLDECSKSIHKVWPIGSVSTQLNYRRHLCQQRSKRLNWMNSIPSWARKKRNLRSDDRGSRHTLCSKLGCGAGKNFGSSASMLGTCTPSQTVLQWCFSGLRYFVLWGSVWNADRQTRNLFGRSGQCRFTPLPQTTGSQVKMLFEKNAFAGKEHPTLCLLL